MMKTSININPDIIRKTLDNPLIPKEIFKPWSKTFIDKNTEHQYRKYYLQSDMNQMIFVFGILIVTMMIFIISDYYLLGMNKTFKELLVVRTIIILITAIGTILSSKLKNENKIDAIIFFVEIVFLTLLPYIYHLRSDNTVYFVMIDIMILFTLYLLIRIKLMLQTIVAISFSIVELMLINYKSFDLSITTISLTWMAYILTNIMGIISIRQLHNSRRNQFYNWSLDKKHLDELQSAMNKIKVLRGLIPICAKCKKVRDDKNYWYDVENYISKHTDALFTHGICPDCSKELYPEVHKK